MTTITTPAVKLPSPGVYTLDPAHSEIGFVARHLVGTKVRGRFTRFTGSVTIADPAEQSSVEAEAEAGSIETGVGMRDDHLRTNDFLDVQNYPSLSLKSTGLTRVSDREWKLAADLTVRGVTRPVVFDLEYHGAGIGMQEGSEVVAFSASTEIDRRDFGVSFSRALGDGSIVVGHRVRVELEVEDVKTDEQK